MKDQTKLYEIVYNRRNDFFRNQGQYLVENYRKVYEERYPKQYKSSESNNDDFSNTDLFTFIENTLAENLNSDFKVNRDSGLIDYHLKYNSTADQLKVVEKKDYLNSIYYFPFFPTEIPLQIRELLFENLELFDEFYKCSIDSHLKKFYIRGHVNEFWLNVDSLYKFGFNKFINQFTKLGIKKEKEIAKYLDNYTDYEKAGFAKKFGLYGNYLNSKKETVKVRILNFEFQDPDLFEFIYGNEIVKILEMNPLDYIQDKDSLDEYIKATNEPINHVRELLKLPRIGEGWISETKLFYQIKNYFKNHLVVQHLKPEWLGRQHFDIYFPILNIAIEFQGKQHFEPIDFFGGEDAFKKNIERDNRKRKLALENNCDLFYLESGYNIEEIIFKIEKSKNYKTTADFNT